MGGQRIRHDHAWSCAAAILDLVRHLMREECQRDAHAAIYAAVMACLEHFENDLGREAVRLCRPSRN